MWERGRAKRRKVEIAVAWLTLVVALVVVGVEAAANEYIYDGKTTYCWQVDGSVYATAVNSSTSVVEAADDNCLASMTVAFAGPQVYANEPIAVTWNGTLNLDSNGKLRKNKFNIDQLYFAVDRVSQKNAQVLNSKLHTCVYGTDCDPVENTQQLYDNSSTYVGNFTDNRVYFSSDELVFPAAGSYALIAHFTLSGKDPLSKRYDFAVFTKVDVQAKSTEAPTTNSPYSATGGTAQADEGVSTEVICISIIGGIVAVSLVVIGFTTMRTKNKPLTATKKDFGAYDNSNNTGGPTITGNGTIEENDFAMLSVHEMTMSSDRPRANTFLTALARGQAEKNKSNPVDYVGPMCQQSFQRNVITIDQDGHSEAHVQQALTLETPLSSREHMGAYTDMDPTPKVFTATDYENQQLKPTSHIMFNDIQEDEVVDDQGSQRKPAADLTEVSQRIREHAAQMMIELQEVESNSKRGAPKMTADDLRPSASQGPVLSLSDLGSTHGLYRYSQDSNYD
uniref:Malectin domain-containing protein n=1 Tax=Globisporangium ultimum (strain ATCC 200006 / CBS 805.95 / DAOM BR144) TaxID=431595 RepID=K3X0T9_GLOUD